MCPRISTQILAGVETPQQTHNGGKCPIYCAYQTLLDISNNVMSAYAKTWQKVLKFFLSQNPWTSIWNSNTTISRSINIKIQSLKTIPWWYLITLKLQYMTHNYPPTYQRKCEEQGGLVNISSLSGVLGAWYTSQMAKLLSASHARLTHSKLVIFGGRSTLNK